MFFNKILFLSSYRPWICFVVVKCCPRILWFGSLLWMGSFPEKSEYLIICPASLSKQVRTIYFLLVSCPCSNLNGMVAISPHLLWALFGDTWQMVGLAMAVMIDRREHPQQNLGCAYLMAWLVHGSPWLCLTAHASSRRQSCSVRYLCELNKECLVVLSPFFNALFCFCSQLLLFPSLPLYWLDFCRVVR